MSCTSNKDCNKCSSCDPEENPCGCDVIVDPSKLNDCCWIFVMCKNDCDSEVPVKVSLSALKSFFLQEEELNDGM